MLKVVQECTGITPCWVAGLPSGHSLSDIVEMQVRAIIEAACELSQEGVKVIPEIMIPLVGHRNEIMITKEKLDEVAREVIDNYKADVNTALVL